MASESLDSCGLIPCLWSAGTCIRSWTRTRSRSPSICTRVEGRPQRPCMWVTWSPSSSPSESSSVRQCSAGVCESADVCVSLCLSVCVCVCVFVSLSLCLSVSVSLSLCVCVSLSLSLSVCICLCVWVCLSLSVCLYLCVCVCVCVSQVASGRVRRSSGHSADRWWEVSVEGSVAGRVSSVRGGERQRHHRLRIRRQQDLHLLRPRLHGVQILSCVYIATFHVVYQCRQQVALLHHNCVLVKSPLFI